MTVTLAGMKVWATCMADFQKYLPRCLWTAGYHRGKKPEPFDDERLRELLQVALPFGYTKQLTNTGWDLNVHTFEESVSKIVDLKPGIKLAIKDSKTLAEIRKKNRPNPANNLVKSKYNN